MTQPSRESRLFLAVREVIREGYDSPGVREELHLAFYEERDASPEPLRECGCTVDAELGAGPVCPACGHRDHGRDGCRAEVKP